MPFFSKKLLFVLFTIVVFQFFCFDLALAASAVQFTPQVSIPNSDPNLDIQKGTILGVPGDTSLIAKYIKGFFVFGIGALAILSVVMIAWGGIQWLTAGGNAGQVTNAKTTILGALGGLILGLSSYVILQTVNPDLVNFKIKSIAPVDPLYMQNITAKSICPTSVKDQQGKQIECGKKYAADYNSGITGEKEKVNVNGCMGYYCIGGLLTPYGVCQLQKDSGGNYSGGGCFSDKYVTVKDKLGQVIPGYGGNPIGVFDTGDVSINSMSCGEAVFKLNIGFTQSVFSLWIGSKCPSGQTCILDGDAVFLDTAFSASIISTIWSNIEAITGFVSATNMSCKP